MKRLFQLMNYLMDIMGEFETSLMLYLDKENVRINKIKRLFISRL